MSARSVPRLSTAAAAPGSVASLGASSGMPAHMIILNQAVPRDYVCACLASRGIQHEAALQSAVLRTLEGSQVACKSCTEPGAQVSGILLSSKYTSLLLTCMWTALWAHQHWQKLLQCRPSSGAPACMSRTVRKRRPKCLSHGGRVARSYESSMMR